MRKLVSIWLILFPLLLQGTRARPFFTLASLLITQKPYTSTSNFTNGHSTTFDGSTQKIDFGNNLNFAYNAPYSISFWAKPASLTTAFKTIVGKAVGNPYQGWEIQQNLTTIEADLAVDNTHYIEVHGGANFSSTSTWYHVAVIYSGSGTGAGYSMYINNSAQTVVTVSDTVGTGSTTNSNSLATGWRSNIFWPGKLNNVSIWNTNISSGQVSSIYNGGTPGDLSSVSGFSTNCKFWVYHGDGDTNLASGFVDHTTSGFNGTSTGTPTISTDHP